MSPTKCPNCGGRLGRFLYAYACPHCSRELQHNTRPMVAMTPREIRQHPNWPVRLFRGVVRFIES